MGSRSWNKIELLGNLASDPELRYTSQGTAVCTFTVATNRTFVSDGEKKEEADFHRIVAWGKLAELCQQLLKKGVRVFVAGRLQNRDWEGNDGQKRRTTEIVIEDMILLTPTGGRMASGEPVSPSEPTDEQKTTESEEGKEEGKGEENKPPSQKKTSTTPKAEETLANENVSEDDLPF